MSLVFNEQTKLLATALNTAATSCFTVGIATPVAGYIYNVGNLQMTLSPWSLGLGIAGWLLAAIISTFVGKARLEGARAMNGLAILAFVITPSVVVVIGYVAVRLHEEAGRRHHAAALERSRASTGAPP